MSRIKERQLALQLINDPAYMKGVRLNIWSEEIATGNKEIGKETGKIEPENLVDQFEKHLAIAPLQCHNWESFILCRLSAVFNLKTTEILEMKFQDGAPQVYACYLEERLRVNHGDQFARILRAMKIFLKEKGLKRFQLLSLPQAV